MADLNKSRYTHRDYDSIKSDLINAIPSLTQEWTSKEESDPGIVLIKLISMFGDTLSYNVDKMALELYLSTVTQRKNCSKILRLLGYKMSWYISGKVVAQCSLTKKEDDQGNPIDIVIRPYVTTFRSGDIIYTAVPSAAGAGDIAVNSVDTPVRVNLVQGEARSVKFDYSNLVNNRFYLADNNVDQSNLLLVYGSSRVCTLVDNLYLATDDLNVSYEFDVDEYDRPYIELVNYWEDILGTTARSDKFTLTYFTSLGASGNVAQNALQEVTGLAEGKSEYLKISHSSNNNEFITEDSETLIDENNVVGKDPQTVEDARKEAAKYVFTHDTLVTADDFEKAAKRVNSVTGSKLVDSEIIENEGLSMDEILNRALDEFPTMTVKDDVTQEDIIVLKGYVAILYLAYGNFEVSSNVYHTTLSQGQDYYVKDYSSYDDDPSLTIPDKIKQLGAYPYKPVSFVTNSVDYVFENSKILNVDINYGTTKVFPFKVSGVLYLNEPMSPDETLLTVTSAGQALTKYYYPDNHDFGERPKFMDIITTVQNSNSNIKYFDADDVNGLIVWSRVCDLSKFDSTSFSLYNGLSSSFTLNEKFMKFKLKNLTAEQVTLENLKNAGYKDPVIPSRSTKLFTLSSIEELDALCKDMSSSIVYVK